MLRPIAPSAISAALTMPSAKNWIMRASPGRKPGGRRPGAEVERAQGPVGREASGSHPAVPRDPPPCTQPRSAVSRAARVFCSTISTATPLAPHLRQLTEDRSRNPGRQPGRRLVHDHQPRCCHECPAHGDHLALAAGKMAGAHGNPFPQDPETAARTFSCCASAVSGLCSAPSFRFS